MGTWKCSTRAVAIRLKVKNPLSSPKLCSRRTWQKPAGTRLLGMKEHPADKSPCYADPLQDFGFSVDRCSKHLKSNLNIRFGIILREDIKELFLDIALFNKGSSILNFSYPICEEDLPKFSFCGRRKGEQIYFAGPINNPGIEIPEGEYQVLLELYNENRSTVACANATVTHS
ncbi:lymphocyte antigen 86 isoform X1 [Ailuropoda melanoleuca]|uniref:lymphocyte antigen 86 isoform X1 n=1 Tax=Ailuropoda melanoleuca TaxID=9646 RepID=UPI001494697E|nr:lymphocyte antigen 86 isoform X1 [Ailuropoda melanoleuca]